MTDRSLFPAQINPPAEIIVYVCPTVGCGDFYAAPDFRADRSDLETPQKYRDQRGKTRTGLPRIACPKCSDREKNLLVKRVPFVVTAVLPLDKVLKHMFPPEKKP